MSHHRQRQVGVRTRAGAHRRSARPITAFAAALMTVAGVGMGVAVSSASAATLPTSNLAYTSLASPLRIADTRTGATDPSTYAGKTLSPGTSLTVDIPPSAGLPANAGAVAVNVTAISPSSAGYLTVYPSGSSLPLVSSVNYTTGQIVGNMVTVGLGPDSATGAAESFTVYAGPSGSSGPKVDFTADLEGYYASPTSSSGGTFVPMTPTRVCDTRAGNPSSLSGAAAQCNGTNNAGNTLGPGEGISITVAGPFGVPSTATAVVLNVAITNPTASGYMWAYPAGSPPATPVANQNFVSGETLSSQVIVGVGNSSQVTIANAFGDTNFVVDLDGYYTAPGGSGSLLTVLGSPMRLADTRTAQSVPGNAALSVLVPQSSATAAVLNVTDLYDSGSGSGNYLTVYPASTANPPLAATVNYVTGDTYNVVGNANYATVGTSQGVYIYNGPSTAQKVDIVVDEFGYFAPPSAVTTVTASPSTLTDPGQNSAITVTVDFGGQPVANDPVSLTTSSNPAGVCTSASLTSPSGTTNSSGQVAVSYTSSSTVGTCTILANEADFGTTALATITQYENNMVAVSPTGSAKSPAGVAANSSSQIPTSTQAITATVTGPSGADVNNDTIDFTATALTPGGCGTLSAASETTTSSGVTASDTYTAPTTEGFCLITATEATASSGESGPASGTTVIADTLPSFPPAQNTPYSVTVSCGTKCSVATNGGTTTLTATVDNSASTAVGGDPLLFYLTPGCGGTISPTTGTTSSTSGSSLGTFQATYTSGTSTGPCMIYAAEADTNVHDGSATETGATVTQYDNDTVAVSADPSAITANGTSTSTVTVTVENDAGQPVAGDALNFTTSGNPAAACGQLSTSGGTTNSSGQVRFAYASTTTPGFCTVTATESSAQTGESAAQSGSTAITQTSG